MKTLLSKTSSEATYKFECEVGEKTITIKSSKYDQDIEAIAEREYSDWLNWLGVSE